MKSKTSHEVITRELLSWYRQHGRDLPWRNTRDPYKIWLSEIILQQTRVAQGLPYYLRFVEAYPKVEDLAEAPLKEVLRLWQGLGYYSRARNLHKCARVLMQQYSGRFPEDYAGLVRLPGVGDYTASAIASFAFGKPEPAVDGNVFRVLARVFGITSDIAKPKTRREFKLSAVNLMPPRQPDRFNQAIMEFGALQCRPRKPLCSTCPIAQCCVAFRSSSVTQLPVKSKKTTIRKRFFNYYLVRFEDQVLMKERVSKDIWQGLFDFLLLEQDRSQEPLTSLEAYLREPNLMREVSVSEPSEIYRHKLTHQHIHARFTEINLEHAQQVKSWMQAFELEQFELDEVKKLPKPILIDNYLKDVIF